MNACRWCGYESGIEVQPVSGGTGVECDDAERCRARLAVGERGEELRDA